MKTAIRPVIAILVIMIWNSSILSPRPTWFAQTPSTTTETSLRKAEAGDARTQFELGEDYRLGRTVPQNDVQAAYWFRKAAEQGHADAQNSLGWSYTFGIGVPRDYSEAARWYRRAAEQGHASAQFNLGVAYYDGTGVPKDHSEAAKWYRKAAEQGNAAAQTSLADLYRNGEGVTQDDVEAAKWIRKAAEQDDVDAQFDLGSLYSMGIGVPRNYSEAAKWYRRAAERGHVDAAFNLGFILSEGNGVQKDEAAAAEWYRKAADKGHAGAQTTLGVLYAEGKGVSPDRAEAVRWYQKAAEQGLAEAQFGLARHYWQGWGIPQDYVQAYRWLGAASAQGTAHAAEQWEILKSQMTPEQITEAEQLCREFTPQKLGEPSSNNAPPKRSGTGFFVTADGYLISNYHVVKDASSLKVVSPAGTKDARLVRTDAIDDIALLKIDGAFGTLAVRPSRSVRIGDGVTTIGFPSPGLHAVAPQFSEGEIDALTGVQDDPRLFQISVPVRPGNSGGALADSSGNVVGVIMAKPNLETAVGTTGAVPENVNYALKSSFLLSFLESVPGLIDRLNPPATTPKPVQQVAAELEKATVLVLAY